MDMKEARAVFMRYDGCQFYMSRDGVEADYVSAGVPLEVEAVWLRELFREKLQLLTLDGNWRVLRFLNVHSEVGHLAEVVPAEPKGKLWERCAYLEQLLRYTEKVKQAGVDMDLVVQAAHKAVGEGERLLKRAKSRDSIRRVQDVLAQARRLEREIELDSGNRAK